MQKDINLTSWASPKKKTELEDLRNYNFHHVGHHKK